MWIRRLGWRRVKVSNTGLNRGTRQRMTVNWTSTDGINDDEESFLPDCKVLAELSQRCESGEWTERLVAENRPQGAGTEPSCFQGQICQPQHAAKVKTGVPRNLPRDR